MSKVVAPGQHGASSQNYVYSRLADLSAQSNRVNIWGVVKFFKEPQRSRGTDNFQMFSIVDDSLDPKDSSAKLVVLLFHSDKNTFPTIRHIGDVIRLHRVNIKPYQAGLTVGPAHPLSKLQAVSSFGFSWVVIDGDPNAEVKPRSASQEYTFSDADRNRAVELRNWFVRNHVTSLSVGPPPPLNTPTVTTPEQTTITSPQKNQQPVGVEQVKWIEMVGLNNYFDVPVLLIGIGVKASDRCILFVTDGSTMLDQRQQTARTLPPFSTVDPSELLSFKMDQELYDKFTNYLVPIVIYDDHCQTAQTLRPGDLVFIKNLHCIASKMSGLGAVNLLEQGANRSSPSIELVLHGKTHFGRGLRKMASDEPIARLLSQRIENLKNVAVEAEDRAMANLANRSSADQSIGPFGEDLLHRQSRYHQSPPRSPDEVASPPKMAKLSSPLSNKDKESEPVLAENDDEWEIVKMRDVGIQTNLPNN